MERSEQLRVVEALVLASPEPLSAARVAQIGPECTPALVKELVAELNEHYLKTERAFEIWEVAGGYQMRTRAEFSGYLQKLQKQRPLRLSGAALETLSIVAYKQPATRAEIEHVRGVDVGAVVKSLLERGLVKIDGHKEVPGRPMLYSTTRRFLEVFGLQSIKDLPALRELEDLAREHGLENPDATDAAEPSDAEINAGNEENAEEGDDAVVDGADDQLEAGADATDSPDIESDGPEIVTAAADDSEQGVGNEDIDQEASLQGDAVDAEVVDKNNDDEDEDAAQTRTIEIASERDVLEGEVDPDGEEPEIVLPSSE